MRVPSVAEAEALLEAGHAQNPGPWREHSCNVALSARRIAEGCRARGHTHLDPEIAYALGLLHDIGRQEGVTNMRHTLDGYTFLADLGYEDAARICLTHSLQLQDTDYIFGVWDCSARELAFVRNYIAALSYDDYDRLFQLCDCLALAQGLCLLEQRMVDVALRHGVSEVTVPKWQATFDLKRHFETLLGGSIYAVLPGVVETTFGVDSHNLVTPQG